MHPLIPIETMAKAGARGSVNPVAPWLKKLMKAKFTAFIISSKAIKRIMFRLTMRP